MEQLPSSCQWQGGSCWAKAPLLDATPVMVAPEAARAQKEQRQAAAGCEYDVWCMGLVLLELLLGSEAFDDEFHRCASHQGRWFLTNVVQLRAACCSNAAWQQPGVAALGGTVFGCMLVEEQQRSSGPQLLGMPCFSAVPTWGEVALLR